MSRSISLQERNLLTIDIQTSWSAGRFGGVYGQSKLSNILHANELAGDLRYVFLRLIHDLLFFGASIVHLCDKDIR